MIEGKNLIAGIWESQSDSIKFKTVNPKTQQELAVDFQQATPDQISRAVEAASASFPQVSELTFSDRIRFLECIVEELESIQPELIATYQLESALPEGRANGEFQRTVDQISRFVELLKKGTFVKATLHTTGPDIRKMLAPLGPIVVFGASNFPLAFSTAGGDTISAFAAACPVIVKAHPYHAGTSELVAQAISKAVTRCDIPHGIFSHLGGQSHDIGGQLVSHPAVKGVGFTGSFAGGKALYDLAQQREQPIPVFAEMGSINPIFITESKLQSDGALTEAIAQSVTLGTGQFCTNPGLIVACDPSGQLDLAQKISDSIRDLELPPMVHSNIQAQYDKQLFGLQGNDKLDTFFKSETCAAAIGSVSAATFLSDPSLKEEVFGPFTLVVVCNSSEELLAVAGALEGQLTATVLGESSDATILKSLLSQLKSKAGRILFQGVPTGVAVTEAMQHGGPFPATTDSRFTSVGTDAIYRWLRPVAFQDCPNALLPDALKDENPLNLLRTVNGEFTTAAL
jgi:alpha-ketoglutaric semialdehyde dehydrogenase